MPVDPIKIITDILNKNQNLNFVQRIMKPDINPILHLAPGDKGTTGTHMMSSAEVNGKPIVYPEIVQGPDGNLRRLGGREAVDYAMRTGEYIPFPSSQEAEWFGQNYKRVWGGEFNPQQPPEIDMNKLRDLIERMRQ